MELHPLISKRWSPRAFSDKPIEPKKIELLFEAARWAASANNEQPWRFLYATPDQQLFNEMVNCLKPGNQPWASKAGMLVTTVVSSRFSRNDKPNGHAFHDMGLAVGNLSLQATSMDLYLHQMAGFYADKTIEVLEIPDGFQPVTFIAVGYLGDSEHLSDPLKERELAPRSRRPLVETISNSKWTL
ncbi:MAG: nitroreductase family protein [Calditrichia bacterium]